MNEKILKPYIVDNGGFKDVLTIQTQKSVKTIELDVPLKPQEEYRQRMWNVVNNFEQSSWSEKSLGVKTGFECLDKAFDGGIKSGFVMLAGDSNLGKM